MTNNDIISAAVFQLQVPGMDAVNFAELVGISSEVEQSEYIAASDTGAVFSRHFGKIKPPTVTLKRGLDRNGALWVWHQKVRQLSPGAYLDSFLLLYGPGDDVSSGSPRLSYGLKNSWPAKVEVSGIKAGATEIVYETVTIMCDEITDGNARV